MTRTFVLQFIIKNVVYDKFFLSKKLIKNFAFNFQVFFNLFNNSLINKIQEILKINNQRTLNIMPNIFSNWYCINIPIVQQFF